MSSLYFSLFTICSQFFFCTSPEVPPLDNRSVSALHSPVIDSNYKTIHIYVALCDNKYQGIVPVPARIGNGKDPANNLYWGSAYGIKTWFKKSKEWKLVRSEKKDQLRLERLIFRHATKNYFLIADAYDGEYIQNCTEDFLRSSAGITTDTVMINDKVIGSAGHASLVSYIGHDGLMDFSLSPEEYRNTDGKKRDVIILACISKKYFSPHIRAANADPLVWTTGLMAPEAYTLHDALTGYVSEETKESIRSRAALAYAKYQKCSPKAARNLLVTGW